MATEKQIQANRLNARKSTGPRTDQGKAASRFNALQHGYRARTTVLPGEDPEEFAALCADLVAHHQPEGIEEQMLVETIAVTWWRMARLGTTEQGLYRNERDGHFREKPFPEFIGIIFAIRTQQFKTMSEIESRLERSYYRAIRELEKLRKARGCRPPSTPEIPPQPKPIPHPEPAAPPPSPPPPIAAKPIASETTPGAHASACPVDARRPLFSAGASAPLLPVTDAPAHNQRFLPALEFPGHPA